MSYTLSLTLKVIVGALGGSTIAFLSLVAYDEWQFRRIDRVRKHDEAMQPTRGRSW
jgi:hypothetical protein